jgi:hypothetical protein
MRTTLDIDDDVLATAKELARRERSSAGLVLSRLAREALIGAHAPQGGSARRRPAVGGFVPFESRGVVVSNDDVNALRDAEGI